MPTRKLLLPIPGRERTTPRLPCPSPPWIERSNTRRGLRSFTFLAYMLRSSWRTTSCEWEIDCAMSGSLLHDRELRPDAAGHRSPGDAFALPVSFLHPADAARVFLGQLRRGLRGHGRI